MEEKEKPRYTLDEVMSIREASDRYKVSRTTIRDYVLGKSLSKCDPLTEIVAGRLRYYELPDSDRREWYVTDAFMKRHFERD